MTCPGVAHVLNLACRRLDYGEVYCEIGSFRGGTLIGALLNNHANAVAIDNESEFPWDGRKNSDVLRENLRGAGIAARVDYRNADAKDVWVTGGLPPIGCLLFDGWKYTADQAYGQFSGAVPHLASRALLVFDDANDQPVRDAAWRLCAEFPRQASVVAHLPTNVNPNKQTFWNGLLFLGWRD